MIANAGGTDDPGVTRHGIAVWKKPGEIQEVIRLGPNNVQLRGNSHDQIKASAAPFAIKRRQNSTLSTQCVVLWWILVVDEYSNANQCLSLTVEFRESGDVNKRF